MSLTYTKAAKSVLYVAAQDRRDCCAGCKSAEKRGEGAAVEMRCTMMDRKVARFSTCAKWTPRG